jgi:hypothetical protein
MNSEDLRARYRPDDIDVLFIGESPPAGGTFFYAANSNLYYATGEAFRRGVPELLSGDFLDDFRALGCFLDDLCLRPVNHLRGTPELEQRRVDERSRGEKPLADRIRSANPQAVAVVMKGIIDNVRSALADAGAGSVPMQACAFPGRPKHTASYIRDLAVYLRWMRDEGILGP